MNFKQRPDNLQAGREAFRAALAARGVTLSAAARASRISREALTQMTDGIQPTLEVVEKWARWIGEDVNYWRQLFGFEVVHPAVAPLPPPGAGPAGEASGAQRWMERLRDFLHEFGPEGVDAFVHMILSTGQIDPDVTVEVADRAWDHWMAAHRLYLARRRNGHDATGGDTFRPRRERRPGLPHHPKALS